MIYFDTSLRAYRSTILDDPGIVSGFGTRDTNLHTYRAKIVKMSQVHGDNIVTNAHINESVRECDGITTNKKQNMLRIVTADCIPILFYDPVVSRIGASHQGWKGTYLELAKKMAKTFEKTGSDLKDIRVVIGPGIGACCYELYGERREMFKEKFGVKMDKYIETDKLNLLHMNYDQLIEAGISPQHLEYRMYCTHCNDKFYSYKRGDGDERLESFIMMI